MVLIKLHLVFVSASCSESKCLILVEQEAKGGKTDLCLLEVRNYLHYCNSLSSVIVCKFSVSSEILSGF